MEFKPLFYSFLVLCLIVLFEVIVNIRKNSFLKTCFLTIIASLFVMNYFSYNNVADRFQFIFVKLARSVYLCSVLLLIIHMVSPKIPRWIIWFISLSIAFLAAIRIYNYNFIDIEGNSTNLGLVFSSGNEFYTPSPLGRLIVFCQLILAAGIILYYYSKFLKKPHKKNIYYKQLSSWVVSVIAPFLLLILFGILCLLNVSGNYLSGYLFSFFSGTILLSILFRPKFLNKAQSTLAFLPIQKMAGPALSSQSFNNFFFYDFYYLQKDASLAGLADKLKTNETNVREYIQQEFGMGINDLLNKHRTNYLLELFNDPRNRDFTIEHLSQLAGFPSRSTMYRAFSKFHGGHPSDYLGHLNAL